VSGTGLDAEHVEPSERTRVIDLTSPTVEGASVAGSASTGLVATMTGCPPGRETTRAFVERIAGGDHGGRLRWQVARWNPGATSDQVEEAFQEACARAERACTGQSEGEVFVWLRTTTHREVRAVRRRAQREVLVDVCSPAFELADRSATAAVDELIDREDHAELERLAGAVLARLSERQRAVVALHSHGVRRPQIAEGLGITPRVVKRSLEQIMAAARNELVRLAGHGCDGGERLVSRFAFGLASPREARQAQLHLSSCARCGAMYGQLDLWRDKVAAILPVPAVAQAHTGLVERTVHSAADLVSTVRRQVKETVVGAREHLADGTAQAKQHAAAAYYRAADPTAIVGVRPGAVAATIAGCLAIGSGAGYCIKQGVGPIPMLARTQAAQHQPRKPHHQPKRARVAQATTSTIAAPAPTPAPTSPPPTQTTPPATTSTQSAPATTTTQSAPPPAPQDEFEPGSAPSSSTSAPATSTTTTKPARAPASGSSEFGGP
jgi:RNA polymerase sigma factor (sigma-70 family)